MADMTIDGASQDAVLQTGSGVERIFNQCFDSRITVAEAHG